MTTENLNAENETAESEVDMSCLVLMAENLRYGLKARVENEKRLMAEHRARAEALQLAYDDADSYFEELKSRVGQ